MNRPGAEGLGGGELRLLRELQAQRHAEAGEAAVEEEAGGRRRAKQRRGLPAVAVQVARAGNNLGFGIGGVVASIANASPKWLGGSRRISSKATEEEREMNS